MVAPRALLRSTGRRRLTVIGGRLLVSVAAGRLAHVHRGREAAADEYLDLDAAVLLTALAGRVVGNRYRLDVAERQDDPAQRDLVLLREVADHRVGALLAQAVVQAL